MNRYLFCAVVAAQLAAAQELQVAIDPATTEVHWTLSGNVHTVHGTFKVKRGQIRFDPATGTASGELVVDAASGESGNKDRDRRMHTSIIESEKYTEIAFVPDKILGPINLAGDSALQIHGRFRIHGAEREATLPAQTHFAGKQMTATLHFPVPYVQWQIKNPSNFLFRVSPMVDIDIQAVGTVTP
jgi:polyisoprenoid-binding protein YceI